MRHLYNKIRPLTSKTWIVMIMILCAGCAGSLPNASDDPDLIDPDDDDGEMVELSFATGGGQVSTRTVLEPNTPLRLFVYQYPQSGTLSYGTPYRMVEGKTGADDGTLSTVELTGGDLTDGKLVVSSGRTYEVVVVVDAAPNAKLTGIGYPTAGAIAGFTHGQDILAARQKVVVNYGAKLVNVIFKSNGADTDGNLPHLGSAVAVEARVTTNLIEAVGEGTPGSKSVTLEVAGMDFKQCMPKSAGLLFADFGTTGKGISVQGMGFTTSYTANLLTGEDPESVSSAAQSVTSADGYILPYPLATSGQPYNMIHTNFRLRVNGGDVLLEANSVQVPEFKPGYRYRFIIEFDMPTPDPEVTPGTINLYLSVEPWQSLGWDSMMGEDDNAGQFIKVAVGSWNSVTWSSAMGSEDDKARVIVSVRGWSNITWSHTMGEE